MKNLLIFFFFVIGVLTGQDHFQGKWYKVGTNWQIYLNITKNNEGLILDQYMRVSDNQNLLSSKKIFKQWYGSYYTKTDYMGKVYNTKLKLIDKKTILYGDELYQKYDLPRDFLKGN